MIIANALADSLHQKKSGWHNELCDISCGFYRIWLIQPCYILSLLWPIKPAACCWLLTVSLEIIEFTAITVSLRINKWTQGPCKIECSPSIWRYRLFLGRLLLVRVRINHGRSHDFGARNPFRDLTWLQTNQNVFIIRPNLIVPKLTAPVF